MMRAPNKWAVAVRRPDGVIEAISHDLPRLSSRSRWARVPFVRGVLVLGESLSLGFRALTWSAAKAGTEEEGEVKRYQVVLSMVFALAFFIAVFMLVPLAAARGMEHVWGESAILFNVVDGVIRVALFVGYIWLIGLSKEIRRVFAFHGAEHKTIWAYESGDPLTLEAIQRYSPRHPRCGTNFLMIVVLIALIAFTMLGRPAWPWLITSRVLGIPVIAGLSYEVLKLGADRRWLHFLAVPGMWLQALTTRQPEGDQVEVAVASLLAALDPVERENLEARGPIVAGALGAEYT
ncbi:MAG: DUF1385 domain-containing protein [Acidimicrobiia bacterium]|nr:DUF1385 domain-containing protein [Acidimicrobiia bacterium]